MRLCDTFSQRTQMRPHLECDGNTLHPDSLRHLLNPRGRLEYPDDFYNEMRCKTGHHVADIQATSGSNRLGLKPVGVESEWPCR